MKLSAVEGCRGPVQSVTEVKPLENFSVSSLPPPSSISVHQGSPSPLYKADDLSTEDPWGQFGDPEHLPFPTLAPSEFSS